MNQSIAPRRSRLPHLAIAAVLGLALVGLTQCRTVSDSVTGVQFSQGQLQGRGSCVSHCNDVYRQALKAENDRFKQALAACGADEACRAAETAHHEDIFARLTQQRDDCKAGCYNEGGGGTGH